MKITRADFLRLTLGAGAGAVLWRTGLGTAIAGSEGPLLTRTIPKSGEQIPVVGLGTAQDFGEADDPTVYESRVAVLRALLEGGGTLIDTSPTYTEAETVVGRALADLGRTDETFMATKISTRGEQNGIDQHTASEEALGIEVIDLLQVHNLRDTTTHLRTIRRLREEGRVRYIGITSSNPRANGELIDVMQSEDIDFVQCQYSLAQRSVEDSVLPVAKDLGVAAIANLPYGRGALFRAFRGRDLPEWAAEFDADTWGQFFLKYLLANDALTAVIPGTNNPDHMTDNLGAGRGALPDENHRARMVALFEAL